MALAPETGFFYGSFLTPYDVISPLYLKNFSLSRISITLSPKVCFLSSSKKILKAPSSGRMCKKKDLCNYSLVNPLARIITSDDSQM